MISPLGMGFRYDGGARGLGFESSQRHRASAFVVLQLNLVHGSFGGLISREYVGNGIFIDGRLDTRLFGAFVRSCLEFFCGLLHNWGAGIHLDRGGMLLDAFFDYTTLGGFALGAGFASLLLSEQAPRLLQNVIGFIQAYVDQVDQLVNRG